MLAFLRRLLRRWLREPDPMELIPWERVTLPSGAIYTMRIGDFEATVEADDAD